MREVELKAVVGDWDDFRSRLFRNGAILKFEGRIEDRRYDTPQRTLAANDQVFRLRIYRTKNSARAEIAWKGPTSYEQGYKIRDELQTDASDPDVLHEMLLQLGYVVTRAVDREIQQYAIGRTVVRLERFPRMDDLVEVEGEPEDIEGTIRTLGLPREGFTPDRLATFVARYQTRTGARAALCDSELDGSIVYSLEDA